MERLEEESSRGAKLRAEGHRRDLPADAESFVCTHTSKVGMAGALARALAGVAMPPPPQALAALPLLLLPMAAGGRAW